MARDAIAELVPLLIPGARFDAATATVTVPASGASASTSVAALLSAATRQPDDRVADLVDTWCSAALDRLGVPHRELRVGDLRTRLVPRCDVDTSRRIVKRFGSYFQLELMGDIGFRRLWVTRDDADALGLDTDQALAAGLRNTLTDGRDTMRISTIELAGDLDVLVASADGNPWVATGLVAVADLFGLDVPPYGVVVAVPRSSAVVCRVVDSACVIAEVRMISRLVADLFRSAADRCSPDLFWSYDGALYPIVGADSDRVRLPPELEPLVRSLPGGGPLSQ